MIKKISILMLLGILIISLFVVIDSSNKTKAFESLSEGMHLHEVINIVGNPYEDVGSGYLVYRFKLNAFKSVLLVFNHSDKRLITGEITTIFSKKQLKLE